MSKTADNSAALNPNNSPVKQKPIGVKRVNNWPLILMFIGVAIFLLIMMLVGMDRAEQQHLNKQFRGEPAEKVARDTSTQAEAIIQGRNTGYIAAAESETTSNSEEALAKPLGINEEPTPDSKIETPIDNAPRARNLPNQRPTGDANRKEELIRQMQQEKFSKLQTAINSDSTLTLSSSGGFTSGENLAGLQTTRSGQLNQLNHLSELNRKLEATKVGLSADPTALYQETLAQIQRSGLVQQAQSGAPSSQPMSLLGGKSTSITANNTLSEFSGSKDRWDLSEDREPPKGAFQLHAGFVIPAIMITAINSDLAGQIMGQISRNIYDSVTGEHLLIPQGSRLVGSYSSNVAFGQEAVFVAWQRIIFPDGKTMDIGSMQGADSAGLAGFRDRVNHHYWRVFGSALMMSVITAGVELSQDDGEDDNKNRSALTEALGQQLGQAAAQLIMRNLNIAPTIEIRSGYRFNIMVSKDMVFNRPYTSYDY